MNNLHWLQMLFKVLEKSFLISKEQELEVLDFVVPSFLDDDRGENYENYRDKLRKQVGIPVFGESWEGLREIMRNETIRAKLEAELASVKELFVSKGLKLWGELSTLVTKKEDTKETFLRNHLKKKWPSSQANQVGCDEGLSFNRRPVLLL